jgi:two-component system response regulator HydG
MMAGRILIIDDDVDLCTLLTKFLKKNGFDAEAAYSGNKGLAAYSNGDFDAVICDYRLGDMDGSRLVATIKEKDPLANILVITAYSAIRSAVDVIKLGAYDYIVKPLIPDEVLNTLNKMLGSKAQVRTGAAATPQLPLPGRSATEEKKELSDAYFRGNAKATEELYEQVRIVANTNYSVLLYGESGTGKEVIAKAIHEQSPRAAKPFVAIDCGTLSKELAGSELFGHMKGSFTGALQDKEGHFEMANGGTLFLDEIGNLSLEVQAALLRVTQERKFKRVGGTRELPFDIRIIVASNENLKEAYQAGRFREDLFHRFNEFPIHLPTLRERKEDILPLSAFFLEQCQQETGKQVTGFSEEVEDIFLQYSWPGNLREFRNAIRRAVLLTAEGKLVKPCALPPEISNGLHSEYQKTESELWSEQPQEIETSGKILKAAVNRAEIKQILAVLQQVNFNKKKAAEILNIDRKTLYNKLKNFHADSNQHS